MIRLICMLALTLWLGACATGGQTGDASSDPNARTAGLEQFGRTPLPVGAKLRANDSLILGVGDNWLGRAVFEVPGDANASFGFFSDQFPRQGWTAIAAMRGKKSLQVFTRGERSATLEMEEGGLLGNTVVVMTVTPVPAPAAAGNPPAGAGVVVQPIGQGRRP